MPKEITHLITADEVLMRLRRNVRTEIEQHRRLYDLGSTSPDLFYYDVPLPFESSSLEEVAEQIHGRSGEDNSAHILWMLDEVKRTALPGAFAFVAGYLTHTSADAVFHPMVYSMTGNYFDPDPHERRKARARHRVVETSLDLYLLEKRRITLNDFNLPHRLRVERRHMQIFQELYAPSFGGAGSPVAADAMRRALRKFSWMLRLMVSSRMSAGLAQLDRLVSGRLLDFVNLFYPARRSGLDFETRKKTPHPVTGKPYDRNIDRLLARAVKDSVRRIHAASDYTAGRISRRRISRIIRPVSLNNGLERTPVEAMTHYRIPAGLERFSDSPED